MAVKVSLFNHKGGVSKTTTTFGLAWALAERGYRVVMVDADPQCNLTGLVIGHDDLKLFEQFYQDNPDQNIMSGLRPAFESQPKQIEAIECVGVKNAPNLFLVPGHINLSEYEVTLGIAQELSSSISALQNLPGSLNYFIDKVADRYQADFVFIDMNPGLGAINQNLLMISDYFIIPMAPDYFSKMAINSLASVLPKWKAWAAKACQTQSLQGAAYPFPANQTKFLGTVIQKYRPRNGEATEGFQYWIDQINGMVVSDLFPILGRIGMTLPLVDYTDAGLDASMCLAQIPDFNTLAATSQANCTPVFAITPEMTGHVGKVLQQDMDKVAQFKGIYEALVEKFEVLAK